MLLIELNEFNLGLLESSAKALNLENISKILEFKHCKTMADEKEERFGLDPWVQWVSIHTGMPASQHGIRHLAETDKLHADQIWDVLASQNISSGIWGAMNAKLRPSQNIKFFFPDPWTYQENASPEELNQLLALPRYYSKSYLKLNFLDLIKYGSLTALYFLRHLTLSSRLAVFSVIQILKYGLNNITLFSIFDLINASLVKRYIDKYKTEFNVVFLNSIAHYQHHAWQKGNTLNKSGVCALGLLDKTIGVLLDTVDKNEPIFILNSFSQLNTANKSETLYRQVEPRRFFETIFEKNNFNIEQLMTNDSHLRFNSMEERNWALERVESISLNGKPAFHCDANQTETEFFCQFRLWDPIDVDAKLIYADRSLQFWKYFEAVAKRTGSHVREGDILYKNFNLPPELPNFKLAEFILRHYEA